jgi:hypothetical protein
MSTVINRKTLFFALLGVLGGLLIAISASKYGPAISTDSVAYIYAAESFVEGRGFVYFGYETALVQWPPLFPALVGILSTLGLETSQAALYLNTAVFALIIFFSGLWFYSSTKRYTFSVIGTMAVLLSIPVFRVSKFVWSEPLLILFTVLFFISVQNYLRSSKNVYLLFASALTALACLTRYMGVVLIFTGLLMLLFQHNKLKRKFGEAIIFGFISSFPLLLWAIRNYMVSSTFFGARTPSVYTLRQNIEFALHTIVSWLLPIERLSGVWGREKALLLAIIILAGTTLIIIAGVLAALRRKHGRMPCESLTGVLCALAYVVLYTTHLIASATSVAFDTIDSRLMAPVFIPLVFIVVVAFDCIIGELTNARRQKIVGNILAVFLAAALVYPAASIASDIRNSVRSGAGIFTSDAWHSSNLIGHLRENPSKHQVYSNCPDAVYILTGIPARYTPKKNSLPEYGFERFKGNVQESGKSYIVWFNKNTSSSVYNVDELRGYFSIEKIATLEDGEVYEVK